jgi:hypothetical protein
MKITDRYRTPADLPCDIPVFPLRGAIVLPRASLPLNIFEPRYLKMFEDVIAGRRVVGIVQPERATAGEESPVARDAALRRIGCLARVTAFQEQDDGRLIVSLTGVSRFSIEGETATDLPYRICRVGYEEFAADLTPGTGENEVDREALLRALKAFLESRDLKADWTAIGRSQNEVLVNSLSVMSPYGPEEKQALLEARDLRTRAEVLVALAEMELAGGRGGTGTTLQ